MKDKKILVCLKYYKGELNPFDASALECALLTGSKDITVLAMAPKSVQENLKGLTRLGVKAVLVTDMAYAGSDTPRAGGAARRGSECSGRRCPAWGGRAPGCPRPARPARRCRGAWLSRSASLRS